MRKGLYILFFVFLITGSGYLSAQEKIELSDIEMVNLGDKQLFAHKRDDSKSPLNGKTRIITGVTTEYIDAEFKEGYATGKWVYYKNNKLTTSMLYKDGYLDGEYIVYYTSGDVKEKGTFLKGQKNGTWEEFKSDGIIKQTEVFDKDSRTKKITYYTDGSVDAERNYKNGKEDGIMKQYTFEGTLKAEKRYVNGKQVGKQMQHYSSNAGNYIETSNYNDKGQLDGDFSQIYEKNKAVKSKGKYQAGKKVGKWVYGYEHQLHKEELYDNGKLVETKIL